ncbi:hypothetical protein J7M22_15035 [Candidatus Poribacteria bacterium]|nr:hypothetical protein [Candidatus Poribacteria bacterium]
MKFFSFIIPLLLTAMIITSPTSILPLKGIIEGCKAYDSSVKSGMGHLNIKMRWTEQGRDLASSGKAFLAFKGGKVRFDLVSKRPLPNGNTDSFKWKQVFDGEKTLWIRNHYYSDGSTFNCGEIKTGDIIDKDDLITSYGVTFWGEPIGALLERLKNSLELVGTEKIDGELCYKIRFPVLALSKVTPDSLTLKGALAEKIVSLKKSLENKVELLINPEKGYRVQEIRVLSPQGMVIGSVSIMLGRYSENVWFPRGVTVKIFRVNERSGEARLSFVRTISIEKDFRINIDIPDDLFVLKFPRGLSVRDDRTGRVFIAK